MIENGWIDQGRTYLRIHIYGQCVILHIWPESFRTRSKKTLLSLGFYIQFQFSTHSTTDKQCNIQKIIKTIMILVIKIKQIKPKSKDTNQLWRPVAVRINKFLNLLVLQEGRTRPYPPWDSFSKNAITWIDSYWENRNQWVYVKVSISSCI